MTDDVDEGVRRRIGERVGGWTIAGIIPRGRRRALYVCQCDRCGAQRTRSYTEFRRGYRCTDCGARGKRADLAGMPRIDPDLPFDQDPVCQNLIAERGDFTLEEIGAALGVTRQRIRQIEAVAIRKLLAAFRRIAVASAQATKRPSSEVFSEIVESLRRTHREHPLGAVAGVGHMRGTGTQWTTPPVPREHEAPSSEVARRIDAVLSDVEAKAERVTSKMRKLP